MSSRSLDVSQAPSAPTLVLAIAIPFVMIALLAAPLLVEALKSAFGS